jgi:hypothetical protein
MVVPVWLWLLLLTLSSARVTHLITTDTIAQPFRDLFKDNEWLDELVHCPWCIGAYISLLHALLVRHYTNRILFTLVAAAAISYAVGYLETRD